MALESKDLDSGFYFESVQVCDFEEVLKLSADQLSHL